MENTATKLNNEAAATIEQPISDELRNVVLEREAYAEKNPNCWISYDQAMAEIQNV